MQIREKVFLNRDGSGTFSLELDMGDMFRMLEGMGVDPDEMEEDPFQGIEDNFLAQQAALNAIDGVDGARVEKDEDGHSIAVLFDFDNVDALNAGANLVLGPGGDDSEAIEFYRYANNRFERSSYFDHAQQIKTEVENNDELEGMDPSVFFNDMSYSTEFEFEAPIRKMSNEDATLSADNRTVTYEYFFFRKGYDEPSVENVIKM